MSTRPRSPPFPAALAERFEVLEVLGQGSFGAVFRARDRELDRDVAIKVLPPAASPDAAKRLRHEAEALARLEHPGVVRVYGAGEADEGPYLIMECLRGRSLDTGTVHDPLRVMHRVAEALEAVHQAGIVHRDVKPSNIVRAEDGRVVLVDFGLVQAPEQTRSTRTGALVGTPVYLAPELMAGEGYTPASDWFAWGVTLFVLAEGRRPYEDADLAWVSGAAEVPLEFSRVEPDSATACLVRAAMERNPARRPRGVGDLRRLMKESASRSLPRDPLSPAPPPPAGGGWVRRLTLGGALLGVGALAGWQVGRAPPQPARPTAPRVDTSERDQAVAALREAARPLLAAHRADDGGLYVMHRFAGDHLVEVLAEFRDVRVVPRMRRLLERILEVARLVPGEADEILSREVTPLLVHLSTDEGLAYTQRVKPRAPFTAADAPVFAARLDELEALRQEFRSAAKAVPGLAGVELITYLDRGLGAFDVRDWLATVEAQLEAERDPGRALRFSIVLGHFLTNDLWSDKTIRCELRDRLWDSIRRHLQEARSAGLGALETQVVGRNLLIGYQQMVACRSGPDPALVNYLEGQLDELEARVQRGERHAIVAIANYVQWMVQYFDAGGGILVRDPALRALVDRARGLSKQARQLAGIPDLPENLLDKTGLSALRDF